MRRVYGDYNEETNYIIYVFTNLRITWLKLISNKIFSDINLYYLNINVIVLLLNNGIQSSAIDMYAFVLR